MWKYEKSRNIYFNKLKRTDTDIAIVFIHGFGGSRNYWRGFDLLSDKFTLYFIDLLGFGFSKKPNMEYSLALHIAAINSFVLRQVEEKKIILIGHSLGAVIALGYTEKHPQRILKTILISLPYYSSSDEARKYISSHSSISFLYGDTFLAHMACHMVCAFRPIFLFILPLLATNKKHGALIRDSMYHTHKSYFSTLKNVVFHHRLDRFFKKGINNKIVIVHGEDDKLAPVNIRGLVNRFKLKGVFLKGGHDLPYSEEKATSEAISRLLKTYFKIHRK